jgi:hypothetical protein
MKMEYHRKYGGSYLLKGNIYQRISHRLGVREAKFYMHKVPSLMAASRRAMTMNELMRQWDSLMNVLEGERRNILTVTP